MANELFVSISSTKAAAASKKTILLKKLRAGLTTRKIVLITRNHDPLFAACCTIAEIDAATRGESTGRVQTKINPDLYDDDGNLKAEPEGSVFDDVEESEDETDEEDLFNDDVPFDEGDVE